MTGRHDEGQISLLNILELKHVWKTHFFNMVAELPASRSRNNDNINHQFFTSASLGHSTPTSISWGLPRHKVIYLAIFTNFQTRCRECQHQLHQIHQRTSRRIWTNHWMTTTSLELKDVYLMDWLRLPLHLGLHH